MAFEQRKTHSLYRIWEGSKRLKGAVSMLHCIYRQFYSYSQCSLCVFVSTNEKI